MKKIFLIIVIMSLSSTIFAQISANFGKHYIMPDIGTPGYSTQIDIITKWRGTVNPTNFSGYTYPFSPNQSTFGTDGFYANDANSLIRVFPENAFDNNKITVGPLVVSYGGQVISTQIFINPEIQPNSSYWNQLDTAFKIPIKLVSSYGSWIIDTFYIVNPFPALTLNDPSIEIGNDLLNGTGIRSPRGAMIFDDLSLTGNGSYKVNTTIDPDPYTVGNQAFLPTIIISLNNILIDTIDVSGDLQNAGPGGGGGGSGSKNGTSGKGFTSGGYSCSWGSIIGQSGISTGVIAADSTAPNGLNLGNYSINGVPGGGGLCDQGGGGGTGFPVGLSGGAGAVGIQTPLLGGYGAGSAGGEIDLTTPVGGEVYGGGGGGFGSNGEIGDGNLSPNYGRKYGNKYLIPLSGGSGGAAGNVWQSQFGGNGGGGGGAIALYAYGTTNIKKVKSLGGNATNGMFHTYPQSLNINGCSGGGGGAGGGIIIGSKVVHQANMEFNVEGGIKGLGGMIASNLPVDSTTTYTYSNDSLSHDGGNGGLGRVRIDGIAQLAPSVSSGVTIGVGPTTDTNLFVLEQFTLSGTANGNNLKIYIKPHSGSWSLIGNIAQGTYTDTFNIPIDITSLNSPDDTYYLVVLQEANPTSSNYVDEPDYIVSQLAANVFQINRPVIAEYDSIAYTNTDTVYCDILANDYDINGDSIYSSIISGPTYGSAAIVNSDSIILYPDTTYAGVDTIWYEVCDAGIPSYCDTSYLVIYTAYPNMPPYVFPLEETIYEETSLTLDTLNTITDYEGDSIIVTIINEPDLSGDIEYLPDGTIIYYPDSNFFGIDTIIYEACDTIIPNACAIDTIIVNVLDIPDEPIIIDSSGLEVDTIFENTLEDTPVEICFDIIDVDFSVVDITSATAQNGVGNLQPIGDTCLIYQPDTNFFGNDTLFVTICETNPPYYCDSVIIVIDVIGVPDPPEFVDTSGNPIDIMDTTTLEDTPIIICPEVYDPDGDTIDISFAYSQYGSFIFAPLGDTCFTYIPDPNFNGIDSAVVFLCKENDNNNCDSLIIAIDVEPVEDTLNILDDNGLPTEVIDTTTAEDTPIEICLDIFDPDNDPAQLSMAYMITNNGMVSNFSTGDTCFLYTPNPNFNGIDSMVVFVCQTTPPFICDSALVIVNVTPVPDSLQIVDNQGNPIDILDTTTVEDTPIEICLEIDDPDFDPSDVTSGYSISGIGQVVLPPTGDTCFTYIPPENFYGLDTLFIEVCETVIPFACDTIWVIVDVTPVNDTVQVLDPLTGNPTEIIQEETLEDTPIDICFELFDPEFNVSDVTNAYSITGNGTAEILPMGDTCFTYTPNPNFFGIDSVYVTVCELPPSSGCDTVLVIINVLPVNDQPGVLDSLGNLSDTLFYNVIMNDSIEDCFEFFDVENDSVYINDILTNASNGSFEIIGDTCFKYIPDENYVGTEIIEIILCDFVIPSACDTITIIINVSPDNYPPEIFENGQAAGDTIYISITEDESIVICPEVFDPDGDSTIISVAQMLSATGTVIINEGDTCFTYIPDENYDLSDTIEIIICDIPGGLCDTVIYVININPVNDGPDMVLTIGTNQYTDSIVPYTSYEDVSFQICLGISDVELDSFYIDSIYTLGNGNIGQIIDSCFTYSPYGEFWGFDTIVVVVCDTGVPVTCTETMIAVTILEVNDPPVANPISIELDAGTFAEVDMTIYVSDVDHDYEDLTLSFSDYDLTIDDIIYPTSDSTGGSYGDFEFSNNTWYLTFTPYPGVTQKFQVHYTITDNHLTDPQQSIPSTIEILIGTDADLVFIPSVFTPNGDGINDLFEFVYLIDPTEQYGYIKGVKGNHLYVYNRWGNLVYEMEDYPENQDKTQYWNGTYYEASLKDKANETIVPEGTYYYIFEMYLISGQIVTKKGFVVIKY